MCRSQQRGIGFNGIRLFFSPPSELREERKINTRERGVTGHHFRIEVAVSHCHLVTFVRHCTFKPSFFSPLLFISLVSARAHCLNSPGDILCCNLKTRGQEIKCKGISLKPIGRLVQRLLLFSADPHPPFSFHRLVSLDLPCDPGGIYLYYICIL